MIRFRIVIAGAAAGSSKAKLIQSVTGRVGLW